MNWPWLSYLDIFEIDYGYLLDASLPYFFANYFFSFIISIAIYKIPELLVSDEFLEFYCFVCIIYCISFSIWVILSYKLSASN